ncbi:MAG: hypothetical protein ACLPTF_21790 [Steroidobacteraceae bacterium]
MTRQAYFNIALIAGLFILGGLCGLGVHTWIGGLGVQHAQLERCILASKHSHSGENARSTLAHLDVEVPACMNAAGYEKALNNKNCAPAFWQGDVFCYLPKSYLGKLIYRIEAASDRKKFEDESKGELQAERRLAQQMLQPARLHLEAGER